MEFMWIARTNQGQPANWCQYYKMFYEVFGHLPEKWRHLFSDKVFVL